ncbi:MAG: sugar MFS transporter, partial [Sphingomonas sp.]|nr:sugar MFS transporter [Sphingomonas sp.]
MAIPSSPGARADISRGATHAQPGSYRSALTLLASLFFMWGFITVINNTLLPHLRSVFELDYTQTTLIESVWFIAYFVASLPSAKLIQRIGYQKAIVIGLLTMAAGALLMVPAARIPSYGVILIALFIIASGITLLQVAANPYVTVIGPPETGPARLNLVQAFNSLGTMLAPLFAGYLILGRSKSGTATAGIQLTQAERYADAQSVILPYLIVATVLIVIAFVIARFHLPAIGQSSQRASKEDRAALSLWSHRNLVFGVPAIFIYLIAEIGVANLFISFVSQPDIANITHETASRYLALLWGGMMVGRFLGSFLMRSIPAETVLAIFSVGAFVVMLVTTFADGSVAMWS